MHEIVLHHYPLSPYSEKIRLLFGMKSVNWRSVDVPVLTPRPLLSPMIGGFRRIPILQIGADFYCDTLLISQVIERLYPSASPYPEYPQGIVNAVCWWIEKSTFMNSLCLTVGGMVGRMPEALVKERKPFFDADLSPERLLPEREVYLQRVNAHIRWIEHILSDGRTFILGKHPSVADLAAYHILWFARQNGGPEIEALLPALTTSAWYERISAIGHGTASDLSPENAIEIARNARPPDIDDWSVEATGAALNRGDWVTVTADDHGRDPILGRLIAWTADTVTIRRDDSTVGAVNLHFPRVGFDVRPSTLAN